VARPLTLVGLPAAAVVGLVLLLDAVLGAWPAALIIGPLLWGTLLYGFIVTDRRLFPSGQALEHSHRRPSGPVIDVASRHTDVPTHRRIDGRAEVTSRRQYVDTYGRTDAPTHDVG